MPRTVMSFQLRLENFFKRCRFMTSVSAQQNSPGFEFHHLWSSWMLRCWFCSDPDTAGSVTLGCCHEHAMARDQINLRRGVLIPMYLHLFQQHIIQSTQSQLPSTHFEIHINTPNTPTNQFITTNSINMSNASGHNQVS